MALLADRDQTKRQLGVNLILEARRNYEYDPSHLRKFAKPLEEHINFDATDYSQLLNYDQITGKKFA